VQIPVNPPPMCSWREWKSHLAHLIKPTRLQSKSLCKIPYVVLDQDSAVVMTSLNSELGLQISYLCKIPWFVIQIGGGCSLEVSRGGLSQTLLQDGKKRGADGDVGKGSIEGDIEALRLRMQKMEDLLQEQSKDLKAEVLSSQQSMKSELMKQMDDFFARLVKVQTSTPPPQPSLVESMASKITHVVDYTPTLGESSVTMPMFKLSASPPS
jgi:hypothetical protein